MRRKSKFVLLLICFSILSSLSLILLSIGIKKIPLESVKINGIIIIKDLRWFLVFIALSFFVFLFLELFSRIIKNQKIDKKRIAFSFGATAAKVLAWGVVIGMLTSLKDIVGTKHAFIALGILSIAVIAVHFIHAILTTGVYKKFSDPKFKNQNYKKFQYIFSLFIACVIVAIPMIMIRLIFSQIEIDALNNASFDLLENKITLLNSHCGLLSVCFIDCLCLIFGFLLVNSISSFIFEKMNDKDGNLEEKAQDKLINSLNLDKIKVLFATFYNFQKKVDKDNNDVIVKILNGSINKDNQINELKKYFFDKVYIGRLKVDIREIYRQIDQIRDERKKKYAKLALENFKKEFFVISTKQKVKNNFFKAFVSVASTLFIHVASQIYTSGGGFSVNQIYGIAALSLISAIVLAIAMICDLSAANKLLGEESVLSEGKNWDSEIKNDKELWKKIRDWKYEDKKIRCGCEVDNPQEKEPCSCCCVSQILSQMLLYDNSLTEEEKYTILDALDIKNKKPSEMSNGGSCPCSSLANSGEKPLSDAMHDIKFNIIMTGEEVIGCNEAGQCV